MMLYFDTYGPIRLKFIFLWKATNPKQKNKVKDNEFVRVMNYVNLLFKLFC